MRIKVVSRRYFEEKQGKAELADILASYRVVSIQSTYGMDSKPPFEKEMLSHPNLLTMIFDDEWDRSYAAYDFIRLFKTEDAKRIVRFVGDGRMPLIVQCTAGISRSGAVGSALDWYFNQHVHKNPAHHDFFMKSNPQIRPNPLVMEVMMNYLKESDDAARGRQISAA